jgi:hypothetical protein
MGDDEDEVIIIDETCDDLKEDAEDAFKEFEEKRELREFAQRIDRIVSYSAVWCWWYLREDQREGILDFEKFMERAKDCSDIQEKGEELDEKLEDLISDEEKSFNAWQKAEAEWKKCIHEETRVRMRLPE